MAKKSDRRSRFEEDQKYILEQYQEKLAALYVLYPEFNPSNASNEAGPSSPTSNIASKIRQVVRSHPDNITVEKVAVWLSELDPGVKHDRTAISNTLARFARLGHLTQLTEPRARPAAYAIKSKAQKSVDAVLKDL